MKRWRVGDVQRLGADRIAGEAWGVTLYDEAASNMSISERETTTELDKVHEVEGEIREFVRRDVASLRRNPETDSDQVANNISSLLQRVAGTSVQEMSRV